MAHTRHKKKRSKEAYPTHSTLFSKTEQCEHGNTQTTNVTVNIEEQGEDCLAGCFKMLAGLGKKAAQ